MRVGAIAILALGGCLDYGALTRGRDAGDDLSTGSDEDLASADSAAIDAAEIDSAGDDLPPPSWCTRASLCPNGAVICEGFEGGGFLSSAIWSTTQTNGTFTIETQRLCRGTRAAHIHSDASGGLPSVIITGKQSLSDPIFLRAFFYFTAPFDYGRLIRVTESGGSKFVEIDVEQLRGTLSVRQNLPGVVSTIPTTAHAGLDRWQCFEMEVNVTASDTQVRVWLDELSAFDMTINGAPVFDTAAFGLLGSITGDLWMDELVVDNGRIGCAR